MKYFNLEFQSDKRPADLLRETLVSWTGQLADNGYALTSQSEVAVTFHRKYRHWAVILLAIVFFPFGLLALLITEDATVTATIDRGDDGDGSVLVVNGRAPCNVRRAFEVMEV